MTTTGRQNWSTVNFNTCSSCGIGFTTRWPRLWCQACTAQRRKRRDLKAENERRLERLKAAARPHYACLVCGVPIGMAHGDKRRSYCTATCKEKARIPRRVVHRSVDNDGSADGQD